MGGTLASRDLKARCAAGLEHDGERWAERKRALTPESCQHRSGRPAEHEPWQQDVMTRSVSRNGRFGLWQAARTP
jgi:hypothetical protein